MRYKPGNKVPDSGIYDEFNAYGTKVDQVTNIKGYTFPPTLNTGKYYTILKLPVVSPDAQAHR